MIVRIRPPLDIEKMTRVLAHAPGQEAITEFENTFADRVGACGAIAVDRGRAALLMALKILNIKPGDEVIVQSFIFHAVIDAILETGAKPVLADSRLEDFNIDPESIESMITAKTKAVIATHLGMPCDMDEISWIAHKHNCVLIENCAHTLGAEYNKAPVGRFGNMSFYSFDVDKPVSTGDGGMLLINDPGLLKRAQSIRESYRKVPLEKEEEIVYGLLLHYLATSEDFYPRNGFLPVDYGKQAVKKDKFLQSMIKEAVRGDCKTQFRKCIWPYMQKKQMCGESKSCEAGIFKRLTARARMFIGKPRIPRIDHPYLLMNSLRSSVGAECQKDYGLYKARRDQNAQYYSDHLKTSAFKNPVISNGKKPAFIRYCVLNESGYANSKIKATALSEGFELGIFNWSAPVHLCYPYNKLLNFDRFRLQKSEHLGKKLFSLPIHPYISHESLEKITAFMNRFAN